MAILQIAWEHSLMIDHSPESKKLVHKSSDGWTQKVPQVKRGGPHSRQDEVRLQVVSKTLA